MTREQAISLLRDRPVVFAHLLGFSKISENSLDGVADRDYMLD